MFTSLTLENWRQFHSITIDFHPRLTILTGANGSGKTTILNILSSHVGWNLSFLSTPIQVKGGPLRFRPDILRRYRRIDQDETEPRAIGSIAYSSGREPAQLLVPADVGPQYDIEIRGKESFPGIYVSSHRPIYLYERLDSLPVELTAEAELFRLYVDDLKQRYQPRTAVRSPTYNLKRALAAFATLGYGSEYVQKNPAAIASFEGFQRILRRVLPKSIGFRRFLIRLPEVVLLTRTGEFPLDAVSGGVSALIDLAWQIFLQSQVADEFVVIIDEPENHLHPELQRLVLPNLLDAFPMAQFIVATHNPFIVSAVPESNVYVLQFVRRHVRSRLLDLVNKAGSSNEVLREVLGLSNAMPLWVEHALDRIMKAFASRQIDDEALTEMRSAFVELGIDDLFPEKLGELIEGHDDHAN